MIVPVLVMMSAAPLILCQLCSDDCDSARDDVCCALDYCVIYVVMIVTVLAMMTVAPLIIVSI
jgi:hypothetical protein